MHRPPALDPADPFAWIGATIEGKYRVERVVGEGGFGVVYAGTHVAFGEPIAIKCLKLAELPDEKRAHFLEAFRAEGKIMFRLSQSTASIARAIDLGVASSPNGSWTPFLVLEWIEGQTLEEELLARAAQGLAPRSAAAAIELLEPAARGLEAAHRERVAHRDVKPANLMLGGGTVKVLDFGVAKVMQESTGAGEMSTAPGVRAFSAAYAAPEQLAPRYGASGPWTDVFALALVLVEVMIGRRPIDGDDLHAIFAQVTDRAWRPLPSRFGVACPPEVERALARALAVDPRERQPSAGALWDELRAAAGLAPSASSVAVSAASSALPAARASGLALADTAPAPTPVAAPTAPAVVHPIAPPRAARPRPVTTTAASPKRSGAERAVYGLVLAVGIGALAFVAFFRWVQPRGTGAPLPSASIPIAPPAAPPTGPTASPAPADDASTAAASDDARSATLADADRDLVGTGTAWDWSNRCFEHIQRRRFGWARAACDEADRARPSGTTLAMLRYNQGVIAREAGDRDRARRLFDESLRLRESAPVRAARDAL